MSQHHRPCALNFLDDRYFATDDADDNVSREEAEVASWLLHNPPPGGNSPDLNMGQSMFPKMDPYLEEANLAPGEEDYHCLNSGHDLIWLVTIMETIDI
ncbi:unnamed protein product [Linum trigynum]|uniref:Uncharacterized protein n=1 Tax=Linum trigynum TaxID=586398 RepID=A0AAV2F769_9ROSI